MGITSWVIVIYLLAPGSGILGTLPGGTSQLECQQRIVNVDPTFNPKKVSLVCQQASAFKSPSR